MVRKIELDEPTIGNWAALDEAMLNQYYDGEFEPTVAVVDWPEDPSSISIGIHEDGDMIDTDTARERDFHVGRRYGYGGSVGVYGPAIPLFTLWFDAGETDLSLDELSRTSGNAIVEELEAYGIDAVYDHIGDVKYVIDDKQYKAVANAPVQFHDTDLWAITVSIIWGGLPEGLQDVLDEAVRVPPEKFEDKDEKSVTGRMKPLSLQFDQFGTEVSKEEFIDALIDRNVTALLGENEPIEEVSPDSVLEYVEETTPFFESDTWVDRRATSRMCRNWNDSATVGVAAYKSRKLVKASLILDGTTIQDALITGDFFVRPHPAVTDSGAPSELDDALVGVDVSDEAAVKTAVREVFESDGFEMPGVSAEDVVQTVRHAAENTMSVEEYLTDHV
jgi:lipoate-protein ligase A